VPITARKYSQLVLIISIGLMVKPLHLSNPGTRICQYCMIACRFAGNMPILAAIHRYGLLPSLMYSGSVENNFDRKRETVPEASAILEDGTLVEMVFQPDQPTWNVSNVREQRERFFGFKFFALQKKVRTHDFEYLAFFAVASITEPIHGSVAEQNGVARGSNKSISSLKPDSWHSTRDCSHCSSSRRRTNPSSLKRLRSRSVVSSCS
jgi:hypothetical protein